MGHLDMRGHEVLDSTPIESIVKIPTRESVFDMVRRQVAAARLEMEADQEVSDMDEMDFEEDSNGLMPDGGPYVVPDDIPDKITPEMLQMSGTPSSDSSAPPSDEPPSNPSE